MNRNLIANRVREQLGGFMGIFSPRFSMLRLKFIGQMVFGMQARQDVKLSSSARALDEDILAKKTEGRLSRHLDAPRLAQAVNEQIAGPRGSPGQGGHLDHRGPDRREQAPCREDALSGHHPRW